MNKRKKILSFSFLFSILLLGLSITSCDVNNNIITTDDETSNTETEETKELDNEESTTDDSSSTTVGTFSINGLNVLSVGKKIENVDENLEDQLSPNSNYAEVLDFIDNNYQREDEKNSIEVGRCYNMQMTFDFDTTSAVSTLYKMDLNGTDDSSNSEVTSVKVDGKEVEFEVKNGTIEYDWEPEKTLPSIPVEITLTDKLGKSIIKKSEIKTKVNDKSYVFNSINSSIDDDRFTLKIDMTKNESNNKNTELLVVFFDDREIIKSYKLEDEVSLIEFTDERIIHGCRFVIIDTVNAKQCRSFLYWGEVLNLIPFNVAYDDITANSVELSVLNKGALAKITKIELYDDNEVLYIKNDSFEKINITDLDSDSEYKLKIYFSKYIDGKLYSDYFYKTIKTLKGNEELLNLELDFENINSFISQSDDKPVNYSMKWSNGTEFYLNSVKYRGNGKIAFGNGRLVNDEYVTLVIPNDSFFTADIKNVADVSGYDRKFHITDGKSKFTVELKSNVSSSKQTFFLKAGTYKMYAETLNITFENIEIKEIVKDSFVKKLLKNGIKEYHIYNDGSGVYKVGKEFNASAFKLYGNINDSKEYLDYYIEIEDKSALKYDLFSYDANSKYEISDGDIIPNNNSGLYLLSFQNLLIFQK
ncbi:MAG: hypothetical protein K6A63_07520 [Acholeplasmatales bacterium]|nr:hypothetical protein [Acholeplasmatales bacterium]